MKWNLKSKWLLLFIVFFLSACKVELYSNLQEEEANQMLALLMLRKISVEKMLEKGGTVSLRVDKDHFADAVEVMRQNGYPRRKHDRMTELFPANQLVSSPAQEQAKMIYLKEQQLERMLTGMDGVILALVSVADEPEAMGRDERLPSASVFIKYNPEVNLKNRESDIKNLVHDAIPKLSPERISVVMQAATFRYMPVNTDESSGQKSVALWLDNLIRPDMRYVLFLLLAALMILLLCVITIHFFKRGKSRL